jgi:hypothetical protein
MKWYKEAGVKLSAALSIFLFLLSFSALHAEGSREATPINVKGIIEYLEGEVTVNGNPADFGEEIEAGSILKTGDASYCEVMFGGRNIFRLEENTIAQLNINSVEGLQAVTLEQGAMAAVFQKIQKIGGKRGTFSINTPTAVAGIRGTAFFIKVEDANNTYICTCNGQTALEDENKNFVKRVSAAAHKAFRFSRTADGIKADPATLLYHDNASMDRLAVKISYTIPWGTNKDKSY